LYFEEVITILKQRSFYTLFNRFVFNMTFRFTFSTMNVIKKCLKFIQDAFK